MLMVTNVLIHESTSTGLRRLGWLLGTFLGTQIGSERSSRRPLLTYLVECERPTPFCHETIVEQYPRRICLAQ